VQVPLLAIIMIIALPVPLPLHTVPSPAIETPKLELAVAATLKVWPYSAVAGACVVIVIVCEACPTEYVVEPLPRV
jgi:hypothetical protein